jgi:hypothetical protein
MVISLTIPALKTNIRNRHVYDSESSWRMLFEILTFVLVIFHLLEEMVEIRIQIIKRTLELKYINKILNARLPRQVC